jgi:hypothetical protein
MVYLTPLSVSQAYGVEHYWWWIMRDVEGDGRGLDWVTIPVHSRRNSDKPRNTSVTTVKVSQLKLELSISQINASASHFVRFSSWISRKPPRCVWIMNVCSLNLQLVRRLRGCIACYVTWMNCGIRCFLAMLLEGTLVAPLCSHSPFFVDCSTWAKLHKRPFDPSASFKEWRKHHLQRKRLLPICRSVTSRRERCVRMWHPVGSVVSQCDIP